MSSEVLYEVSATVQPQLVAEYERYMLERHIPDVLASGCFLGGSLLRAGDGRYRIAYRVGDEAVLRRYLDEHAPALRADFAQHFPTGVELSRENWRVLRAWDAAG
jgi:hypothetical protein